VSDGVWVVVGIALYCSSSSSSSCSCSFSRISNRRHSPALDTALFLSVPAVSESPLFVKLQSLKAAHRFDSDLALRCEPKPVGPRHRPPQHGSKGCKIGATPRPPTTTSTNITTTSTFATKAVVATTIKAHTATSSAT
jgi:hypothetical protein